MNVGIYARRFYEEVRDVGVSSALRKSMSTILRSLSRDNLTSQETIADSTSISPAGLMHNPLLSVIIVSYNSGKDLKECLNSLKGQSYKLFETIVIENGTENTASTLKEYFPQGRWVKASDNFGFASGNNDAYKLARGEFIVLLNPDARLDSECLFELLQPFRADANIAVTTPKLLFWSKFVDITLISEAPMAICISAFESRLNYKKWFAPIGDVRFAFDRISSVLYDGRHRICLRLPVDGSATLLSVSATDSVDLIPIYQSNRIYIPQQSHVEIALDLTAENFPSSFWVINNAGSDIRETGPYDVGFGEYDIGQYDSGADREAFCGCVAMIHRKALIGRLPFRAEFFAYYEDSELSYYLRQRGYRIWYAPRAVAFHRHSESSKEGSALWHVLVQRSRLIYDYLTTANLEAALNLKKFLSETDRYANIPSTVAKPLSKLDELIFQPAQKKRSVGIYNLYWNTLGGGEAHALGVALRLIRPDDEAYLISESDFDISRLEKRFDLDLSQFRKLVTPNMQPEHTKVFDLFINSTFCSNLLSRAKHSLYIVSFPHADAPVDILGSYYFLYNSAFTQSWAQKLWIGANGSVIYPTFAVSVPKIDDISSKKRIMITVGRMSPGGHAKNQHRIIEAFKAATFARDRDSWRLYVIGGLDMQRGEDVKYYNYLSELAADDPRISIVPNCNRPTLVHLMQEASIYVHAAGLDISDSEPEKQEHFGIAVLEAALFGAYPIVYGAGGPKEFVEKIGFGRTYFCVEELSNVIAEVAENWRDLPAVEIARAANQFCRLNDSNLRKLAAQL